MPTWGKRSNPQEMIGQWISHIEHKVLPDGEHQVWLYGDNVSWIFFRPMSCCNSVSLESLEYDLANNPEFQIIEFISYQKGAIHIEFENGATIDMQWKSSKVGYNMTMDMIKLSKQEI